MGVQGFERRLERLVEGAFGKAFRSGLQPVEIARKLLREMDNGRTLGVRGTVAPNYFLVCLCAEDAERFDDYADVLERELAEEAREHAREDGYHFIGPGAGPAGRGPARCARATSRSRPRSRRAPAAGSGRSSCPTAAASPWAPSRSSSAGSPTATCPSRTRSPPGATPRSAPNRTPTASSISDRSTGRWSTRLPRRTTC